MAETIGVVFDREYYFDPNRRWTIDCLCNAYLREHLHDLDLFFTESNLGQLGYYDQRQVLIGGIQPNMLVGMLLGAEFIPHQQMDADISPTPLAGMDLEQLPPAELLLKHDLVQQFKRQFRGIQDEINSDLIPIPPFFWDGSGRAAIHGVLTSAQKFFGESIFLDLMTQPDRCKKIFDWITDLSILLLKQFAKLGGREITEVHIGECSACMVNAELFERFVVPTLSRIGRELGPIRLHSCGASDHLLDAFRKIENLESLDVGGGTSIATIRTLFGSKLPIHIAPLVDDLLDDTHDGLLSWADQVIQQNADGPLTICYHLEKEYKLSHLYALHNHIRKGASC